MTRESEGRGVSSNHPIKTLPKGRITKEKGKPKAKQRTHRQPTQTTNTSNKQNNKPNDETTPTNQTQTGDHQPPAQTTTKPTNPQNSERHLKISAVCERAHSKLLTYNTDDEVTSDDECGHRSAPRQSNTPKEQDETNQIGTSLTRLPTHADDLENPNSTRRQVENGNWFP